MEQKRYDGGRETSDDDIGEAIWCRKDLSSCCVTVYVRVCVCVLGILSCDGVICSLIDVLLAAYE